MVARWPWYPKIAWTGHLATLQGTRTGLLISRALLPEVPSFVLPADFLDGPPPLPGTPALRRAQPSVLPPVAAAALVGERAEHMR
jgi:hypothetical protein